MARLINREAMRQGISVACLCFGEMDSVLANLEKATATGGLEGALIGARAAEARTISTR
jgi:hypothetical protein